MNNRTVGRWTALAIVSSMVFVLAGCNMAKVGAKCRNGAAPARDATHVLFCQKGKWARVMTIGQAADFIMSGCPSTSSCSTVEDRLWGWVMPLARSLCV